MSRTIVETMCRGDQNPGTQFDHEKLDVYQAELEFITWVTPLLVEVGPPHGRRVAEVCDQLDRASLSALEVP